MEVRGKVDTDEQHEQSEQRLSNGGTDPHANELEPDSELQQSFDSSGSWTHFVQTIRTHPQFQRAQEFVNALNERVTV